MIIISCVIRHFKDMYSLSMPHSHCIVDFLGSHWMVTEPTSIEVHLRPTLGQTSHLMFLWAARHRCKHVLVYTAPGVCQAVTHPIMDRAPTLLNFSDVANTVCCFGIFQNKLGYLLPILWWSHHSCVKLTCGELTVWQITWYSMGMMTRQILKCIHPLGPSV